MISLLLVEDEPSYALLIHDMLANIRDAQFAVEEAFSLAAAIQAIELHAYDLILVDLGLPDSRELATLTALRAVAAQTPIVVVSGHPDEHLPLQAVQGGAQDYLVKGTFNPVALGRVIQYSIERQRIQRALYESERKYRALVEQASDSIFISTAEGILLDVNAQACALLGYSRTELIGISMTDVMISPETPPPAESLAALRTGEITRYELLLRSRDGGQVTVELASKMLDDGRIQTIAHDITERKRAEESLRTRVRQEEAVATLGQQVLAAPNLGSLMDSAVALIAAALGVEFCTVMELLPDGQELLLRAGVGWQPGLVGQATIAHHPSTQRDYTLLSDAVVIVTDWRTETRFSRPAVLADYGVVSSMSVVIRSLAGPFGVLSAHTARPRIFTDYEVNFMSAVANSLASAIGRERAEEALRTSERQFRAVFDNTLAAIFIVDNERCFIKANPAAGRLLGLSGEELIGLKLDDVIEVDSAQFAPGWLSFLTNGRMEGEFAIRRADGGTRTIQLESTASVLPGQHLTSMIDITERKQAEEERLVQQKAQAATEAKNEFLARISHELRTPLNAILGFSQLLEMGQLNPEDRESAAYIMKAGRHLLNLINDVLDLSRVEGGKLSISPEPIALEEVLAECLDLTAPAMAQRAIRLVVNTVGLDAHLVLADRQRLKQVLLNLLSNAVKYNRAGGSVTVEFRQEAGAIRLLISDTGPGIAAANMARLFTAFDRLGAEAGAVEGTGLGLVISKQLIEAMDGQIGAESVLGAGSTFWLELPETALEHDLNIAGEDEGSYEVQPRDPSTPADARTILYIEDNPGSLALVARIVARRPNIRLVSAHSGLGFELARQQQVDMVLLDLHLPEISGEDVLRQLKADPLSREIPVVILSADASAGTIARLLAAGAYEFLTKPLEVKRLLRLLDELLGRSSAAAS